MGWNYCRKRLNTVGKGPTVGIILRPPAPKTHGNFTVFLLTLYKIKPSDGNKRWQQTEEELLLKMNTDNNNNNNNNNNNKQRKKLTTESKDEQKLPVKGWNILLDVLFSMPMAIKVWVHVSVILNQCNASRWRWIKIWNYICLSTGFIWHDYN